jgi:Spy/CpxP family protein refolding chaperone
MKRWVNAALAGALALGCLSVRPALAEEGPDTTGRHAEMAKRWKEKMGLTDAQADKLKAAFKAQREAVEPLRRQLRADMKKLSAELTLNYGEKDLKETMDLVAKTRKAIQVEREKFKANLDSILSMKQRAQMMVAMHRMMLRRRFGERGWRHGDHERYGQRNNEKGSESDGIQTPDGSAPSGDTEQ